MKRFVLLVALGIVVGVWWRVAAPRPEIEIADSITIDRATEQAIRAVDRSAAFAAGLEEFSSNVPPFDDRALLQDGTTALVTATDGRIWRLNLANQSGEPIADLPLMAYGIHEAPGDPNQKDTSGFYLANEALGAERRERNRVVRLQWPTEVRRR